VGTEFTFRVVIMISQPLALVIITLTISVVLFLLLYIAYTLLLNDNLYNVEISFYTVHSIFTFMR